MEPTGVDDTAALAQAPTAPTPSRARKSAVRKAPAKATPGKKAATKAAPAVGKAAAKAAPAAEAGAKTPAKKARPSKKADAPVQTGDVTWVDPDNGICPTSHPVKAKLASRLYHLPGMLAYARTRPDRCYATEEAAQADGLSKARR